MLGKLCFYEEKKKNYHIEYAIKRFYFYIFHMDSICVVIVLAGVLATVLTVSDVRMHENYFTKGLKLPILYLWHPSPLQLLLSHLGGKKTNLISSKESKSSIGLGTHISEGYAMLPDCTICSFFYRLSGTGMTSPIPATKVSDDCHCVSKFTPLVRARYSTTCLIRPAIRLRKKSGLDRGPE